MQEGAFLVCIFVFWWFCFFFVFLFFAWKKPKRLFSCNFRVFILFCVPKRPVFKILLFFLFCFLFWFSFCLPFQNSIFLCFLSINPFLENINIVGFLIFLFLAFSFLNVCLLISNKRSQRPIFETQVALFLVVYLLFVLFLFLFSCFMFLPCCFDVGFVFGMFYFVLGLFLFCFLSCFHRLWKHGFPAILAFLVMLVTR